MKDPRKVWRSVQVRHADADLVRALRSRGSLIIPTDASAKAGPSEDAEQRH